MIRQAISKRIIKSIEHHTSQDSHQAELNGFNHRKLQLICRREIQILANLAARSFGCSPIRIRKDASDNGLKEYAEYTVSCMEQSMATAYGNSNTEHSLCNDLLCATLFRDAAKLGRRIRRISGLSSTNDLEKLVFMLYRNIRIEITGTLPGEITVSKCFFSHYYTPEQCRIMSYVDSGIISGIMGGGRLRFSQRITGGCECCKADFCKGRLREDENKREYKRKLR